MRFKFKPKQVLGVAASFIRKLARRVTYDNPAKQLKYVTDLPEVELAKEDMPTLARALPKHERPSVMVNDSFMTGKSSGTCVYPSFWYFKNKKTFGCPRCPEQDVCPLYLHVYARRNFRGSKVYLAGEHQMESMELAMEYYDLPPRSYKKVVKHPFKEVNQIVSDPVPDLDRTLKLRIKLK